VKNKARWGFFLLAFLGACVLASVTYRFSRKQFIVDNCLSAKHGSFDYAKMACDLQENHIYVPYQVRHSRDKQIAIVALATFAVLLIGYRFLRHVS
jgi:hypothetical protein